jgi:ATP-dependent Clp protease ATP-binding subunit ClpA
MSITNTFSTELQLLIKHTRKVALEMGYDYISTIHFLIANCELNLQELYKFGFADEPAFKAYKQEWSIPEANNQENNAASLPLTVEAETTIRLTDVERDIHKQSAAYPCHFFLAAFKNKESLLAQAYEDDEYIIEKLTAFYQHRGDFDKSKIDNEQIMSAYYVPDQNGNSSFISKIVQFFTRQKK